MMTSGETSFSWTWPVPLPKPWTFGDLDGESINHYRCIQLASLGALGIHLSFECRVTADFLAYFYREFIFDSKYNVTA